jgi:hypothetical protein
VLNLAVDFRYRRYAFRGRAGEPPRRYAPVGSPQPRTPAGVERLSLQSTSSKINSVH